MLLKALALGFSTGLFCLGYCAPILGPLMLSNKNTTLRGSALALGLFISGRLVAYLLFGLCIGLLGHYTKEILFLQRKIIPALFFILGLLMILYGAVEVFGKAGFCARLDKKYFQKGHHLFIIGFLAGINICPPFLLAAAYALSLETVLRSVAFFLFFFLATTVFILPFLFSGAVSRFENVRDAARMTSIIAGIWFIVIAVKRLGGL